MLLVLLMALLGPSSRVHPLHSSSAFLMDEGGAGGVRMTVRIFSDDLAAVAPGGDSAAAAYVRQHIVLTGRNREVIPLDVVTIVQHGDLTQITCRGTAREGLVGARAQLSLLWERYPDQVNLLRTMIDGHTTTLVFSNGDPPKKLR
jgi:hypothetical protein